MVPNRLFVTAKNEPPCRNEKRQTHERRRVLRGRQVRQRRNDDRRDERRHERSNRVRAWQNCFDRGFRRRGLNFRQHSTSKILGHGLEREPEQRPNSNCRFLALDQNPGQSRVVHGSILRSLRMLPLGVLAFVGTLLPPTSARASDPFLDIPDPALVKTTAAYRYANMTNDEALAECTRRNLPYITVDPVAGVRAPIRLTGRLHGVSIHSNVAPNQRSTSPFEILDARLALALDDFTAILEKHDIDEIEHFSMYRPGAAAKAAKTAAPAVAKQSVDPAKPSDAPAKPVTEKTASVAAEAVTPGQDKPALAMSAAEKPATKEPTTNKVVARKKAAAPRKGVAKKSSGKMNPAPKTGSSVAMTEKTTPPSYEKPSVKSPQKALAKPESKHLGKAELRGKTPAGTTELGLKHKEPGETTESASKDKPEQVVVEAPQATAPIQSVPVVTTSGETRHPGGLAIDVGKLRKKDGTWISVSQHFHGKIGDKACGPDAPVPTSAEAKELRALVCEAMGDHIFTYVLTPNYNAAHFDHFHMEIKPGVKWFLVH